MRRVLSLIIACVLSHTAAEPLFAQQRLFARMSQEVVELDPRAASLGTVIRRFPLPEEASGPSQDVVPFGGGEFLTWVGGGVVLLNTGTGAIQRFTFPDFSPTRVLGTNGIARLLVLGRNASGDDLVLVADARSASVRFLDLGRFRINPLSPAITYASAGDILFVAKRRGAGADTYHDVEVIQVSTGALLKTLDIFPVSAAGLSTNAAGTRLYVGNGAFDVVTGTQFASGPGFGVVDEQRNRLIAHVVIPPGATPENRLKRGIAVFSADSLQLLGRVQLPELPLPVGTPQQTAGFLTEQIDVSGLSATIFVLQVVGLSDKYYGPFSCRESQLMALDADTGRLRQAVSTTNALRSGACGADLVRVTEPAAPQAFTAGVASGRVNLTWQAPFGATQYEIEAGSAPGLTNLARLTVTDTQLSIDDVPPGVYHLRVRAINTIGKSSSSQEIRLVVE